MQRPWLSIAKNCEVGKEPPCSTCRVVFAQCLATTLVVGLLLLGCEAWFPLPSANLSMALAQEMVENHEIGTHVDNTTLGMPFHLPRIRLRSSHPLHFSTSVLMVACCAYFWTQRRGRKDAVPSKSSLCDFVSMVECLTSPSDGCPWNVAKTVAQYLHYACNECDEASEVLSTLSAASASSKSDSSLVDLKSELGDVLYTVFVAVSKAARHYQFEPADACKKAVEKVRWRTPYMQQWGDGSCHVTTADEAKTVWKARKASTMISATPGTAPHSTAATDQAQQIAGMVSACEDLAFTVKCLVSLEPGGCPWTRSMSAGAMLNFCKDECRETMQELEELNAGADKANSPQALITELGDVLFCIFMAVALSSRDFGFPPLDAYESAVCKIKGRTPYISAWGDGSKVTTAEEAALVWKARKAKEQSYSKV